MWKKWNKIKIVAHTQSIDEMKQQPCIAVWIAKARPERKRELESERRQSEQMNHKRKHYSSTMLLIRYIIKCSYKTLCAALERRCVFVAAAAASVCCFSSVSFSLFSSSSFVCRELKCLCVLLARWYMLSAQFSWGLLKVSYRMLGHKTISCSTACFRVTRFS